MQRGAELVAGRLRWRFCSSSKRDHERTASTGRCRAACAAQGRPRHALGAEETRGVACRGARELGAGDLLCDARALAAGCCTGDGKQGHGRSGIKGSAGRHEDDLGARPLMHREQEGGTGIDETCEQQVKA